MEKYVIVELQNNIKELTKKNIMKSTKGIVVDKQANICHVMFLNEKNQGEYAFAHIDEKHLNFLYKLPDNQLKELKQFLDKTNTQNFQNFSVSEVKEYDTVEMIVEKEKYSRHNVHTGMQGVVMSNYSIKGEWYVIFTDINTGIDIADICVNEKDFKIIK